jgi:hypothetical protein
VAALDAIIARTGKGTFRPSNGGITKTMTTRQQRLSPQYNTKIIKQQAR